MKEKEYAGWVSGAPEAGFWKQEFYRAEFWKVAERAERILWRGTTGQDLVEYALLAGFVAVAAGALLPAISQSISTIFSRMGSVLSTAAS